MMNSPSASDNWYAAADDGALRILIMFIPEEATKRCREECFGLKLNNNPIMQKVIVSFWQDVSHPSYRRELLMELKMIDYLLVLQRL